MGRHPRRVLLHALVAASCGGLALAGLGSAAAAPRKVDPRTIPVASATIAWTRVVAVDSATQRVLTAGGSASQATLRISPLASLDPAASIPLQITEGDVQEVIVAGGLAYVCSEGRVTVVDLASNTILRRWRTVGARDFAVDSSRGIVYALSRSFVTSVGGQAPQWPAEYIVDAMSATTGAPIARWTVWRGQEAPAQVVPDTGDRLLLSSDGRWLYAGLYGIGQVVKVDTASGATVATSTVSTPLEAIALDEPGGRLLWLGAGNVGALTLDLAALPGQAQVDRTASILVADPASGVGYVGSPQGSLVQVLALPGLSPAFTLSIEAPTSIAAAPAGSFVVSSGIGPSSTVNRYSLDAGRSIPLQSAGPPQQVTAAISGTTADITWSAPANAEVSRPTRYRVISIPAGGSCTSAAARCIIRGLRPGTRYRFAVQAGNRLGWGQQAASPPVLVPKPTPRPPRPSPTPKPSASLS